MSSSRAESYGSVTFSNLRRRRGANANNVKVKETKASGSTEDSYSGERSFEHKRHELKNQNTDEPLVYKYNSSTATLLVPSLSFAYISHHSPVPFMVSMYTILVLYGFDLCGSRIGVAFGIWIAFGAIMLSFVVEHYRWNDDDTWGSIALFFDVLLLFCTGCWGSLQLQWLYYDGIDYARGIEAILHTFSPIASAAVITRSLTDWIGIVDLSPFLMSLVLYHGISKLGSTPSSYHLPPNKEDTIYYDRVSKDDEENKRSKARKPVRAKDSISEWAENLQCFSLLCLPTMINIWLCSKSPSSAEFIATKELCSLLLAASISYITFWLLKYGGMPSREMNGQWHPSQNWKVITAAVTAFISFQYRYLIPISVEISYHFHGRQTQSPLHISLWFSCGVLGLAGTSWLSQKRNSEGGPLLGQRHDDFCIFGALASLFIMETAFPFPYDVLLLGLLSVVSIGVFAIEKTVPSMIMLVFVNGSGLVLLLHQRFFFTDHDVWIVPGHLKASFLKFTLLPNLLAGLIFVMYSVVTRRPSVTTSLGQTVTREMKIVTDFPGMMLLIYSLLLVVIEGAMHYDKREETNETAYPKDLIFTTSIILLLLALKLQRDGAIGSLSATAVGSVSISKTISMLAGTKSLVATQNGHKLFLYNLVICILFCFVVSVPYLLLTPARSSNAVVSSVVKKSRNLSTKGEVKSNQDAVVICYCGVILPVALSSVVPTIIMPAIETLCRDTYYRSLPTYSESFGYSIFSWGVTTLMVLRYSLPEGGLQGWRKIACAAFILGALLLIVGPITPFAREGANRNSFYPLSRVGIGRSKRDINGAWGLIAATISILLSFAGPLRLASSRGCKSNESTNTKRAVIFSLLFGSGLSWFLTNQLVEDLTWREFVCVSLSTSLIGFLHTFSSILIYNVDGNNSERLIRTAHKSIATSFILVIFMILIDMFIHGKIEGFRPGGGHSVNLITCSTFLSLLSFATKATKKQNRRLSQLVNTSSTISWLAAIVAIYSSFGLVGVGVRSSYRFVIGIPISVILTFAVAPLLGNCDIFERQRTTISKRRIPGPKRSFEVDSERPTSHICIFGTLSIFISMSLYAILIRGLLGQDHVHTDISGMKMKADESIHNLAILAERYMTHRENAVFASRLAACGFWTSDQKLAPLKHLAGLVLGPVTTWYTSYTDLFQAKNTVPSMYHWGGLLFNIMVVIFCKGIPSLSAAALLCALTSTSSAFATRRIKYKNKMSL